MPDFSVYGVKPFVIVPRDIDAERDERRDNGDGGEYGEHGQQDSNAGQLDENESGFHEISSPFVFDIADSGKRRR